VAGPIPTVSKRNTPSRFLKPLRTIRATAICLLLPLSAGAELIISGISGDAAQNVRVFASLAGEPCNAEQWRIRRRFRSLEDEAALALQPFGYYRPTIDSSLSFAEDCWTATLTIDAGKPVRLRNVAVRITGEASTDPGFEALRAHASLQSGRILRHAAYERYKRELQVLAADRGYVDARLVENRIDVWPDELAADIDIEFASGERYLLGEVRQQQTFMDPELVAGFMDLSSGQPFERSEITRAYGDLSDSGYFGRIQLLPDYTAAEDGRIPLVVELEPGTRIEYTVGLGASTDTGPRFRAGFRNNRLNPRGHRLKSDLNISTVLQGLTGEYRIPLRDPRIEWLSYRSSLSREITDTFETKTAVIGMRRSRRLSESWIRTLGLDLTYDNFVVGSDNNETFLAVPSISFDHKFADQDLYPKRGRRFTVELLGTSEWLGSSTSFVQATAWGRLVRSLGENTRLFARGTLGRTETRSFDDLPPSVRYFAGGDQSIRGYAFESLGPTNDEGEVIGGTNLAIASLEIERRIRGNWFGAVFVDAGNAFNDDEFDPKVGAGLGIKWRSPVGPVRVYVGFPVDEDNASPRLHIGLGAEL